MTSLAIRMLVTETLQDLGYDAIEAVDGPSGLRVLQSDARIDLLVTDVGLPGTMNGRQMADAARVKRPDLKVLFITGFAENAAVGNGQLEPGMHVLTKPFALETLASRIKELVARDSGTPVRLAPFSWDILPEVGWPADGRSASWRRFAHGTSKCQRPIAEGLQTEPHGLALTVAERLLALVEQLPCRFGPERRTGLNSFPCSLL